MNDTSAPTTVSGLLTTPAFEPGAERRMAITLYSVLLPVVVLGFILQLTVDLPAAASASMTLSEVADGQLVEIRDEGGKVVLSGEFRSRVDSLGNTEKDAELTDQQGRSVIGEVELEIPAAGLDDRRPARSRRHSPAAATAVYRGHRQSHGRHVPDRRSRQRRSGITGRRDLGVNRSNGWRRCGWISVAALTMAAERAATPASLPPTDCR